MSSAHRAPGGASERNRQRPVDGGGVARVHERAVLPERLHPDRGCARHRAWTRLYCASFQTATGRRDTVAIPVRA
jgi:hypothetical protein